MAVITNYTTLVQAIMDLAEDDGAEFQLFIPTAIDLAEEILIKELDLPDLEIKATGTLTQFSPILPKPVGYRFANYMQIVVDSKKKILQKRREDYINDYWPDVSISEVPKYYSDTGAANFAFAPTPDQAYAYELKYTKAPDKLSTTNQTNYFINSCKDILLAACMIEMTTFMKAWSQIPVFEKQYAALRDDWNIQMARKRRDDGSVPNNPDGPNTLKHTVKTNS